MTYLKILNKIKEKKSISKYVVMDTRVIGNSSSTGDIVKVLLKKNIDGNIEKKELFIQYSFNWEKHLWKNIGVTNKESRKGIPFSKAFKEIIKFTKGFVVLSNQARAIKKTFIKNCSRHNVPFEEIHFLDVFLICRLAFQKNKSTSVGGFADSLKIYYDKSKIVENFNIINLLESTFLVSIEKIIKNNIKPKPFIDYERNFGDAKIRMYSRITIIIMLIALIIFVSIML